MKNFLWLILLGSFFYFVVQVTQAQTGPTTLYFPSINKQQAPTETPTPINTPTPTPTPTPTFAQWKGEYFNNTSLSGTPVLVRNDPVVDFNWGDLSPDPAVAADNFSVRWTRTMFFTAGTYHFFTYTDDGVRLWVDVSPFIDSWIDQASQNSAVVANLTEGFHTIRMEYYDRTGGATASVRWINVTQYPQWQGEYFNNTTFGGDPVLVRNDASLDFDWGLGSPGPGVATDNFSVRWTRSIFLTEGNYNFLTFTDDGIRIWVDGRSVINEWYDQSGRQWISALPLSTGMHSIRVEYYEGGSSAFASVLWTNGSAYPDWQGEYFNNPNISGTPIMVRNDVNIDFDWGTGSPASVVNVDNFSVRWMKILTLDEGTYVFNATADDGVRLWVDGRSVINEWRGQEPTTFQSVLPLEGGVHTLRMEYFDSVGGAVARLSWTRSST